MDSIRHNGTYERWAAEDRMRELRYQGLSLKARVDILWEVVLVLTEEISRLRRTS